MVALINGAFGIGKTAVARALVARLPGSVLFDPEMIGLALQRTGRLLGRSIDDFQDLQLWRRLTVVGIRAVRTLRSRIIVPMTFSNTAYLREVRNGISRFEPRLFHFCLVAPVDVVHARLRDRGSRQGDSDGAWQYRRAAECCAVHGGADFLEHVSAVEHNPAEIAEALVSRLRVP